MYSKSEKGHPINSRPFIVSLCLALLVLESQGAIHDVQRGTRQNTIALDITNRRGSTIHDLTVRVTHLPDWITITASGMERTAIAPDSVVEAVISFDVSSTAKMGASGDIVIVITAGDGVVARKSISVAVAVPTVYELSQNYPNPFNPTTTIEYQLPADGFVTLKVYDTLGREVATLVNEQQKADYYKATFNGGSLASGVYFYRLQIHPNTKGDGGFTAVKRLMVLK
jgi:hypothetical protein